MGVDPKGSKTDGVGRHASISDPARGSLHGDGPVALVVEVTVNAGGRAGLFEKANAGTGA